MKNYPGLMMPPDVVVLVYLFFFFFLFSFCALLCYFICLVFFMFFVYRKNTKNKNVKKRKRRKYFQPISIFYTQSLSLYERLFILFCIPSSSSPSSSTFVYFSRLIDTHTQSFMIKLWALRIVWSLWILNDSYFYTFVLKVCVYACIVLKCIRIIFKFWLFRF